MQPNNVLVYPATKFHGSWEAPRNVYLKSGLWLPCINCFRHSWAEQKELKATCVRVSL